MTTDALASGYKTLHSRADAVVASFEHVSKVQTKTGDDMTKILSVINEMRASINELLKLQDVVTKNYKNVDKIIMGDSADAYEIEEYKPPPKVERIRTPSPPPVVREPSPEPVRVPTPEPEPVPEPEPEPEPVAEEPAAEEPAAEEPAAEEPAAEEPAAEEPAAE